MLQYIVSNQTNPYLNVAVENHLLSLPERDTVTLYLWKNRRTVVIGMNQNPFSECNVEALEADGGYLMRRRTGGGAVYHDDGNLNFSFIVPKSLYDLRRQFSVLQRAVETFGIRTELSGRNDVLADGRKFSGNAFSKAKYQDLHHGTILIRGNMDDLQRYLKPKPAKLMKHGVSSVQSRVVNLADLNPDITPDTIAPRLVEAFEQEYGAKATLLDFGSVTERPDVQERFAEFASPQWKYGSWRTFTAQRSGQFDWGGVELALKVDDGTIREVQLASDALDLAALDTARALLIGASAAEVPQHDPDPIVDDILTLAYSPE
ncbi:MAG: lipoate--protein ligase [Bacteroidales bacterium]|nr:lipoate--protein ligase [Bacteroidales bacterium]